LYIDNLSIKQLYIAYSVGTAGLAVSTDFRVALWLAWSNSPSVKHGHNLLQPTGCLKMYGFGICSRPTSNNYPVITDHSDCIDLTSIVAPHIIYFFILQIVSDSLETYKLCLGLVLNC